MKESKELKKAIKFLVSDKEKTLNDELDQFVKIEQIMENRPDLVTRERVEDLLRGFIESPRISGFASSRLAMDVLRKTIQRWPELLRHDSGKRKTKKKQRGHELLKEKFLPYRMVTTPGLLQRVDEAFDSLKGELKGLAVGTQSVIKGMMLLAAFKDPNRQIQDETLRLMKERVIPALRIVEALTQDYPTLHLSQQVGIDSSKIYENWVRGLGRVTLANFLRDTPFIRDKWLPKDIFLSRFRMGEKQNFYELKTTPSVYPFVRFQLQLWEKVGILREGGTYHLHLRGNHISDGVFLFLTSVLLSMPMVLGQEFMKHYRGSLEHVMMQVFEEELVIDPWTGERDDKKGGKFGGSQTDFFAFLYPLMDVPEDMIEAMTNFDEASKIMHEAPDFEEEGIEDILDFAPWLIERGVYVHGDNKIRYYPYDLKAFFTMVASGSRRFKTLVMDLLSQDLGPKIKDKLFPKELQQVSSPTVYKDRLQKLLSHVLDFYSKKDRQHLAFQKRIDAEIHQLYGTIFPEAFEDRILQQVFNEDWDGLYQFLVPRVIYGGPEISEDLKKKALELVRIGKYPETDAIVQSLGGVTSEMRER